MRKFLKFLTGFLVIGGILLFIGSGLLPTLLQNEEFNSFLNRIGLSSVADIDLTKYNKEIIGTINSFINDDIVGMLESDIADEDDILNAQNEAHNTSASGNVSTLENDNTSLKASNEDSSKPANMDIQIDGNEPGYAYSRISDEEKRIYLEILDTLQKMETDRTLSTVNTELLDKAFNCVLIDHPELFYVKGYSITKFTRKDTIEKINFEGRYTCDFDEAVKRQLLVDDACNRCLAKLPEGASEYDKVKFVYDYIIKNTEYDVDSAENQNILSVLLNGRSVCQGYAKTTQLLLNKLGIFCTLVEGVVKENEPHVFNIVRIDGNYYYVDTTWGDASYKLTSEDDEDDSYKPDISYDYLCITRNEIEKTHVIKEIVDLPECNSMIDNYYVREGLYFTSADPDMLEAAFDKAYEEEDEYLTLKCSDENVYDSMYDYLIKREHIFDYIRNSNNNRVVYIEMKEKLGLLFYLE